MRAIKYLIQNTNPLNLLLLAIIIVIAIGVIFPLTRINAGYVLPQVKTKITEQEEKPEEKSNSILPSDYAMIGETNLFIPKGVSPLIRKQTKSQSLNWYFTVPWSRVECSWPS